MIKILTDSTCDILQEDQIKLGIHVIPLTVYFGEKGYQDGSELTREDFYDKLVSSEILPTTSQLNPTEFLEVFEKEMADGDEVICILVSSKVSGTYQSAVIAAQDLPKDKIHVIDSNTGSMGLFLLLKEAARLRDEGKSALEITNAITELTGRVRLYALIETLKYLKIGGRISASTAIIGGILGIQPIIEVCDGTLNAVGKARGLKAGLNKLLDYIKEYPADFNYGFAYGHANCYCKLKKVMDYMSKDIKTNNLCIGSIGSVVGTHSGPGAICIAYIDKEK